ncbi:MAG: crossover junction endodeoxyribonuclease RuvC [Gammaproteobacteria bacterium]|nr:crossover junction endodeoxyribonuclease RuvC [Gammaproteobacteria bacterium]
MSATACASGATRILGIDPGSRITGYGIVDVRGRQTVHVTSGCIHVADGALPERLHNIFDGLLGVIDSYRPAEMAVEMVFMSRNADSALKLGQARGAAIVAGATRGLAVFEFSPRQIKQAVVGRGGAAKEQVQHMVRVLLSLRVQLAVDAADALAVALCHAHMRQGLAAMGPARAVRRGRLQ